MNKRLTMLVSALILLNILDLTTTHYALTLGAVEINPLMARGFGSGYAVLYKILGVSFAIALTAWRIRRDSSTTRFYTRAYTVFCVIYSLAVLNNVVVIVLLQSISGVS